jgi:hypothetical protein
MKKLFLLLLCLAVFAGFVSAGVVRPLGEISPALPGYGVGYEAVAPDTVLITQVPIALTVSLLVVPVYEALGLSQETAIAPAKTGSFTPADHPLLC